MKVDKERTHSEMAFIEVIKEEIKNQKQNQGSNGKQIAVEVDLWTQNSPCTEGTKTTGQTASSCTEELIKLDKELEDDEVIENKGITVISKKVYRKMGKKEEYTIDEYTKLEKEITDRPTLKMYVLKDPEEDPEPLTSIINK